MILTTTLVLLAGILTYLLLMPLEVCLDSFRERYFLRMGVLARLGVEKDPEELIRLHLKVLFLNFYWRPTDISSWSRTKKKTPPKYKGPKKRGLTLRQAGNLMKSFRVKSFRLEMDTGNPVLNARLYPWIYLLGQRTGGVGINFLGRNHISLRIVNRPIYILNAFINPKK
jgi:hypothetical protein